MQANQRLNDQREALCEVIARPAIQPHAGAVLARDHAEAIVLDFVQPRFAGWRVRRFDRKAWRDEAARQRHGLPIDRWCGARQTCHGALAVAGRFRRGRGRARSLTGLGLIQ
jgi:hypothetical protein